MVKETAKPRKLSTKNYNTTQLDPYEAMDRCVTHRDQLGHHARWSHVLKEAKIGDVVIDFGCGTANLLETLYRNRFKAKKYVGLDVRQSAIDKASEKFKDLDWADFKLVDLVKEDLAFFQELPRPTKVCSFEVLEHVGKVNGPAFMERFAACGDKKTMFYLSTPNYDEHVGAAGNHTYDSGDGNGIQPQELTHEETAALVEPHFEIIEKFGVFASQRDYKPFMTDAQKEMFEQLSRFYDTNWISIIFAPLFPEQSRNTMWKLRLK